MTRPRQRAHAVLVLGAIATLVASTGIGLTSTALASAPSLYAWGLGTSGQLGNGSTASSTTPTPASMPTGVTLTSVTAGELHACGLTAAGAAYCWGDNLFGQVGNGSSPTDSTTPTAVSMPAGITFTSIASGGFHTCALTAAGAAYCWGDNDHGQLGDNTVIDRTTPVAVSMPAGITFTSIASGGFHTCALTAAGAAYCWGDNDLGQLGNGSSPTDSTTPTAVSMPAGITFTNITAGYLHTCALTAAGAAYCWGDNSQGQLGDNSVTIRTTPVAVITGGLVGTSITAGGYHTCAGIAAGTAYCWGDNDRGQLGDGTFVDRRTPVAVITEGITGISITAGFSHTCGLASNNVPYCWGDNLYGQLGDGTLTDRTRPTAVSGGLTFASLVSGSSSDSTFGIVPIRASGDVPTAPMQQFTRSESGTCDRQPSNLQDFPGVTHLADQRWGPSWAQWPNSGTGGFVCTRQPFYTSTGTWAVE